MTQDLRWKRGKLNQRLLQTWRVLQRQPFSRGNLNKESPWKPDESDR